MAPEKLRKAEKTDPENNIWRQYTLGPNESGSLRPGRGKEIDYVWVDEASKLKPEDIEYRPSPWQKEWLEEVTAMKDDPKLKAVIEDLKADLDKEVTRTLTELPKAAENQAEAAQQPIGEQEQGVPAKATAPDQDKEGWGTF